MQETVDILFQPVCECGYIFTSLKLVESQVMQKINGVYYSSRDHYFDPDRCPKCGKKINTVIYIDPTNDNNKTEQVFNDYKLTETTFIRQDSLAASKKALESLNSRENLPL